MPASKHKMEYDAKWSAENLEHIQIRPSKRLMLSAKIDAAVSQGKAASRTAYIVSAILAALDRDGITAGQGAQER